MKMNPLIAIKQTKENHFIWRFQQGKKDILQMMESVFGFTHLELYSFWI